MTRWLFAGVMVLVTMGALYRFACWLIARHSARYTDAYIDGRIEANAFRVRYQGFDPALRERSAQRRQAADGIRARAARVDSGARVADVLRVVKRGSL